jgi:hypothetical protein
MKRPIGCLYLRPLGAVSSTEVSEDMTGEVYVLRDAQVEVAAGSLRGLTATESFLG